MKIKEILSSCKTPFVVRNLKNINVKITIHGPNGELENLKLIHELENKRNVKVNVTAMMSAQQCFLAAKAGASYVSIFGGRVNNMGYDSNKEIDKSIFLNLSPKLDDKFDPMPIKIIIIYSCLIS